MKKGVPIEGRVVDADGKPVDGRTCFRQDDEQSVFPEVKRFAVFTDADGHFRTGQVKSGDWFLVASAPGHGPGDQRVKVGTAVPQVEIKLGKAHTFKGRVVDLDGKPVAGAFVDPDVWKGKYRCLGAYLWTDADGRFRWHDAPNDELTVNVSKQGYVGVFQHDVEPTSEDVIFKLVPCLPVHGTVRDAGRGSVSRTPRSSLARSTPRPVTSRTGTARRGWGPVRAYRGGFSSVDLPVDADLQDSHSKPRL